MKIEKRLRITKITASHSGNAPLAITLIDPTSRREKENGYVLTMDKQAADRRGIPYTIDAIGKTLTCIIRDRPHKGYSQAKTDVLFVESLSKEELVTPYYTTAPPTNRTKIIRTLKLTTHDGGDGIHFHPLPCPHYCLEVELNKEEYPECKKLLPRSVFEVEFKFES